MPIITGKKGVNITLGAIFAVVIFFVLAFATARAISKILPSERAEKSFNELADKIKDAKEGLEATTIYMDEETAVMGFLPSSNSITIKYNKGFEKDYDYIFNRPNSCVAGKTCLCLCKLEKSSTGIFTNTYNCIKELCENFDFNIKFSGSLCKENEKECIKSIESDDLILIRNIEHSGTVVKEVTENPRIRAIYVEKSGNNVGVCLNPEPSCLWGGAGGKWQVATT